MWPFGKKKQEHWEDRCGNCDAYLDEDDRYCKYCGTKRGEGKFIPEDNIPVCVYGPPVTKKYLCSKCGHAWITHGLVGGKDSKYCPRCGDGQVEMTEMIEF